MILPVENVASVVCNFCSPQASALEWGGEGGSEEGKFRGKTHTYSCDLVQNVRRGSQPDGEQAVPGRTWKGGQR